MPWCVAVANIKRENIPKNPKIYRQHFEDSCFKRNLEFHLVTRSQRDQMR